MNLFLQIFLTNSLYNYPYNQKEGDKMHFMFGYGPIWPMICMIIAWLGLICIGVLLIRNFTKGKPNSNKILKERFAKGEIDKEEFERLKSVLKD